MGFSKPPGVPCPPNNPHCQGNEIPEMPIDNWVIATVIVILILIYTFYIMKPKLKITAAEMQKLKEIEKEVSLSWFDKVSTFLWGDKSFSWGELRGL